MKKRQALRIFLIKRECVFSLLKIRKIKKLSEITFLLYQYSNRIKNLKEKAYK